MPLPSFVSSIANKAQATINQQFPAQRPASPDLSTQPSANDAAAQGGSRSHAFESLQHHFRTFQQQYATTTPVQRIITSEKGLALDFDGTSRDVKAQSKELYTWGQGEADDIKDVTDRLAYLNFIHGSLARELALKLDGARNPMKTLRDTETALTPRRNTRAGLHSQLARIEHDQPKGMEKKIAELKDQIKKAELDDAPQENEIEILKRKGIRDSEQVKWDALREYGEKLVLLSQAASQIVTELPSVPPTSEKPYEGAHSTALTSASFQGALKNYQTGNISLVIKGADLGRHDTRSFGQTHASELSSINVDASHGSKPGIPLTPPAEKTSLDLKSPSDNLSTSGSSGATHPPAPINPMALNQAPAPIPSNPSLPAHQPSSTEILADSSTSLTDSTKPIMTNTPTVAETGVPVSAGEGGPGPASGSLKDLKEGNKPQYDTAEEEKRRLAAEYSQTGTEKSGQQGEKKDGDDELPKYQEY